MKPFVAILAMVVASCATIPDNADPLQYRLREATLNLETVKQAIPAAGFEAGDQVRIEAILEQATVALQAASEATSAEGAIGQLEVAIPVLEALVDSLNSDNAKKQGTRVVAVLNVTVQVLKNQAQLEQEFGK